MYVLCNLLTINNWTFVKEWFNIKEEFKEISTILNKHLNIQYILLTDKLLLTFYKLSKTLELVLLYFMCVYINSATSLVIAGMAPLYAGQRSEAVRPYIDNIPPYLLSSTKSKQIKYP